MNENGKLNEIQLKRKTSFDGHKKSKIPQQGISKEEVYQLVYNKQEGKVFINLIKKEQRSLNLNAKPFPMPQ